jgi:hypothetical protein
LNNKLEKREIYGSDGILGGETFHDQVYQEELKSRKARDKREIFPLLRLIRMEDFYGSLLRQLLEDI